GDCSRLAQILLRFANGATTPGEHRAEHAVPSQVLFWGRIFRAHLRPIRRQLLSHKHWQGRENTLAHFRAGYPNNDSVIWLYDHPGVHLMTIRSGPTSRAANLG